MVIRNTSSYPNDEVRELVELATRDVDMRRVCVNVKGGKRWGGRAYSGVPAISNAPPSTEYLVTIRLPKVVEPVDHNAARSGRWPVYRTRCWRELLVAIAAHEAKHVEQFREELRCSEVRCEWFARAVLGRYRGEAQKRKNALGPELTPTG